ncbi:MAG: response regulator transcription factor [Ruminococcus sp.]|nr:response regulator transcription factor [Ruminococcus sp.]
MDKVKILVTDDDRDIVAAIAKLLEMEGYSVIKAYDGLEALEKLSEDNDIKLVIIDIMMPRLDGLSAIMKIREKRNLPVLVLSAKSEDSDKVLGLSIGADDYITKPYSPSELVARVNSSIRRYTALGSETTTKTDVLAVGGLEFDLNEKILRVDGEPIRLTAKELSIMELFMRNPGRVFSAEQIYTNVWKETAYSVENTVMVHIRHLREKIEINPKNPRYIKVVWGVGYKLEKNH